MDISICKTLLNKRKPAEHRVPPQLKWVGTMSSYVTADKGARIEGVATGNLYHGVEERSGHKKRALEGRAENF